ncbi:MAG: radical SAM family heme chaperone HemW [Candidatus Omnitrophota bacterium]
MEGLYIHIPFCRKKCFYCSFNVAINHEHHAEDYVRGLCSEMNFYQGRAINSIYFGGGSPSRLNAKQFSLLMDSTRKKFCVDNASEVTVEINPEDADASLLKVYRDCGVNRLSIGIQTFQDRYLKFLGRCHDSEQAVRVYDRARQAGFDNINIDLMCGFPGQTPEDLGGDLEELKKLSCEHVSVYLLTIEEGSRFFVDRVPLPEKKAAAEQYLFTVDRLRRMGFEHYEVSNFAKSGRRSSHNLNYWRCGHYIGLGAGAHSHENGRRWWNVSRVKAYIEKAGRGESPEEGAECLTVRQRIGEALAFGLRMIEGIRIDDVEKSVGSVLSFQNDAIMELIDNGFLEQSNGFLKVTTKGLLVLDDLALKLL